MHVYAYISVIREISKPSIQTDGVLPEKPAAAVSVGHSLGSPYVCMCVCVYIYIYIEREREKCTYDNHNNNNNIYIYIYTHTQILHFGMRRASFPLLRCMSSCTRSHSSARIQLERQLIDTFGYVIQIVHFQPRRIRPSSRLGMRSGV